MTDALAKEYRAGPHERKFCEVVLATYGAAERIHPVISQFLLAREEIISTSRTEALREAAEIVRSHNSTRLTRACMISQNIAEAIESLITTDKPDSVVHVDDVPR